MQFTREQIEKAVRDKGYVWFNSDKDFDVNIVGIRNESRPDRVTNVFDDLITVSYKVNGVWQFHAWPATVDPGTKGVREFRNPRGVARLVEGQYRRSHTIGMHQGKYRALTQASPLPVYRDNNRDMIFDETTIHTGVFGINIHKAGRDSTWVENWSEGCQVFRRAKDFDEFMRIINQSAKIHGNLFTYTLLKSTDVK